jgi:hypothetical protein
MRHDVPWNKFDYVIHILVRSRAYIHIERDYLQLLTYRLHTYK